MRQSNSYIVIFALVMCVVVGGLLSLAAVGLKPAQKKAKDLDTKKQILGAVMAGIQEKPAAEVDKIYNERIESLVVNYEGDVVEGSVAEALEVGKEYKKKDPKTRLFPVFKYKESASSDQVDAYILPMYGKGLWDNIWGYVALNSDLKTVRGIVFDHKGETPGLGARITSEEIQVRYKDKKIADDQGAFQSVTMVKGEGNKDLNAYEVDGMSGATLTAVGVNDMLKEYLEYYLQGYFVKINKSEVDKTSGVEITTGEEATAEATNAEAEAAN